MNTVQVNINQIVEIPLSLIVEQLKEVKDTQRTPKIGEYWPGQGGVYAGLMRNPDGPDYHLILAISDESRAHDEIEWGGYQHSTEGASSEYDGQKNTTALLADSVKHPVAEVAKSLSIDGHADFYVPAQRESALLYATLPDHFEKAWHWTSTQRSADYAVSQDFGYGNQTSNNEDSELAVRFVRRLFL